LDGVKNKGMIIVNVGKSIDQALKQYKNKHNKIGIIQELRDRQTYTKPSVKRRGVVLKAKYVESKRTR
jgi:small subunit ribosomal protein S21